MHLARRLLRVLTPLAAVAALVFALSSAARADRVPLLGTEAPAPGAGVLSTSGAIVAMAPDSISCMEIATFDDVSGGDPPGTSHDGLLWSGGMLFGERFMGQTLSSSGDFDVVSGTPLNPLTPLEGIAGQNLDVFTYASHVLSGLGPLGFPDMDAIGEGSMALYFPTPLPRVKLDLVGGNGGSATLDFYRADGSHLGSVAVTGLGEFTYGFSTDDGTTGIAGILIQTTDPSGLGVDNVCHEGTIVGTQSLSWGRLKTLYR